jgi:hypothetical protein
MRHVDGDAAARTVHDAEVGATEGKASVAGFGEEGEGFREAPGEATSAAEEEAAEGVTDLSVAVVTLLAVRGECVGEALGLGWRLGRAGGRGLRAGAVWGEQSGQRKEDRGDPEAGVPGVEEGSRQSHRVAP